MTSSSIYHFMHSAPCYAKSTDYVIVSEVGNEKTEFLFHHFIISCHLPQNIRKIKAFYCVHRHRKLLYFGLILVSCYLSENVTVEVVSKYHLNESVNCHRLYCLFSIVSIATQTKLKRKQNKNSKNL